MPTYVEYGAADIGIVGKDTILEEGRKLYEVLDLGYGACRMCVCGPASAADLLQHNRLIRVATKYPNIAKDYFYNKKHQTVEIIKLNGSIELAPIVGLSEVIVDIVETGTTLRENGLDVLEEVCPLSARMVVNQVSMRMEERKNQPADRCAEDGADGKGLNWYRKCAWEERVHENCKSYEGNRGKYTGKHAEAQSYPVRDL